ncbi:hypothetical protein ACE38W_00985 [Chitinophaga sp. Hz27]|uniref:hypothetical protein n=1 Tax=Chitinophaga sp. Hz27 TaxID=3347169 RepID=UPI0035DBB8EF
MIQSIYSFHYVEQLTNAGIGVNDLPDTLQASIEQMINALEVLEESDTATKERFLPLLAQSDAIIAAMIYKLYPPKDEVVTINKMKLLSLKAKAISLKMSSEK